MRYFKYLLGGILLLSLLTGLRVVEPGERAVVLRLGRVVARPGPGLYVGLPWGIDQVYRVPINRVRSVQIGYAAESDEDTPGAIASQLVTGDHNLVQIRAVLDYTVREDEVERFVFQQERAEELLIRTAESVLSQWVSTHGVETVLLKGKLTRVMGAQSLLEALVAETQERLKEYQLGVEIADAHLVNLSPPSAVRDAFNEVYQAETQIKKLEYDAREYAKSKEDAAHGSAHGTRLAADSEYYDKKAQAEAQAQSFEKWVTLAKKMKAQNPYYLNSVWWDQVPELYGLLKANGQIDLLDHRMGPDGLDLTIVPSLPKK